MFPSPSYSSLDLLPKQLGFGLQNWPLLLYHILVEVTLLSPHWITTDLPLPQSYLPHSFKQQMTTCTSICWNAETTIQIPPLNINIFWNIFNNMFTVQRIRLFPLCPLLTRKVTFIAILNVSKWAITVWFNFHKHWQFKLFLTDWQHMKKVRSKHQHECCQEIKPTQHSI